MIILGEPILTLDPSTKFGWALRIPPAEEDRPSTLRYGTWKLGEKDRPGAYFFRLWRHLTALRKEYGIEGRALQIVIEDTSLNATGTRDTKHLAESWLGQVELYCEVKGLPAPIAVGVNSWRSAFIGRSMAPKEVGAGLTGHKRDKARRDWIKGETMRACERRGLTPADDNQADALGIMFWHLNGGVRVLEQRREDRKAKTKAKRAQKKFAFGRAA